MKIYGELAIMIGLLTMCPALVVLFHLEELPYVHCFLIPGGASILLGVLVRYGAGSQKREGLLWKSNLRKGSTPVLFVWCYAFLAGAMPFVLSGQMTFVLALFESVSGWTTTGLTVADVEHLPNVLLFHRSFMQYCGGLGFVIMIAMVMQSRNAADLYSAEGHQDRLSPSLKGTSKLLSKIYLVWLVIGSAAYCVLGMTPLEGICHTMSALSTAGFSTRSGSIGAFCSVPVDIVTIILMLIGASNFAVLKMFMKFEFKSAVRDSEFRFMVGLAVLTSLMAAADLMRSGGMRAGSALLHSVFGVVTTFSTTGYGLEEYSVWPAFSLGIVLLLMIVGGCAGSTAGGIKMNRAYLLIRNMFAYISDSVKSPREVKRAEYQKNRYSLVINNNLASNVSGFVFLYIAVLAVGILALTIAADCTLSDAAFEFTSALGTVGLSCDVTSADASNATLFIEMIAMIMGRLEILVVFVGLYSVAKKLKERGYKR